MTPDSIDDVPELDEEGLESLLAFMRNAPPAPHILDEATQEEVTDSDPEPVYIPDEQPQHGSVVAIRWIAFLIPIALVCFAAVAMAMELGK